MVTSNRIFLFSDPQFDKFIGCYKDNSTRDLWAHSFALDGTVNSPTACVTACASKTFPYAAVQNLRTCFCSFTYGRYGEADSYRECNDLCDPNAQDCGIKPNAVYKTGKECVTAVTSKCGFTNR